MSKLKNALLRGLLLASLAFIPAVGFAGQNNERTEPVLAQATPRVEKAWGGWRGGRFGIQYGRPYQYRNYHNWYPYRYNSYPYRYYNYYNYPYYRPFYRHYYNWW